MRHDRAGGKVSTQAGILVIEGIGTVSHQVGSPMALDGMDAVLTWAQDGKQLEISLVIWTNGVVVNNGTSTTHLELAEVSSPAAFIQRRIPEWGDRFSGAGLQWGEVSDRLG